MCYRCRHNLHHPHWTPSPRITSDVVIICWIFYHSNELDCMVNYFFACIWNAWFIEDEIHICRNNHKNWSFLEDTFKRRAAPVNDITASNWNMQHFGRVIFKKFCCLIIERKSIQEGFLALLHTDMQMSSFLPRSQCSRKNCYNQSVSLKKKQLLIDF